MTLDHHPPETATRIATAALDRFVVTGFNGTSMRQIAGDVGVTPAALYYHYASKDALLAAVVEPFLGAFEALLDVPGAPPEPAEVLGRFLHLVLEHKEVVGFIERDRAAATNPVVAPRFDAITHRLRNTLLTPGPHDEDDLVRVSAVLGVVIRPVLRFERPERFRETILAMAARLLG